MDDGLRARKKRQTRRRLVHAAVELAEQHGVDAVTVADIATRAGVSRRTFFNYFPTREAALVGGPTPQRVRELASLLADRPPDEAPWLALRNALAELWDDADGPRRSWVARVRLARAHPSLASELRSQFADLEDALVEVLTARMAPTARDLSPRLLVALAMATTRVAVDDWLDSGDDDVSLAAALDAAMSRVSVSPANDPPAPDRPG